MLKDRALVYGNCQHTHLERMLTKTSFNERFNFIRVKDVYCKDRTFLDPDTLSSLKVFIYQHVSRDFDPFFSTDNILKFLSPNCIKICIPNFWFSGFWPSYIKNPVIRRNSKYSISPSGLFPYGDSEIINLLQKGLSTKEIISTLAAPDFYNINYLNDVIQKNISSMSEREELFDVQFKCADFIRNNYQKEKICHSINHPTKKYFEWLTENILSHLGLKPLSESINYQPFEYGHIHVPIFPSIIKQLDLRYLSPDPDKKQYRFYNELISFNDYVEKYISHISGGDVSGKDVIDVRKWKDIKNGNIKLLDSNQTNLELDKLKTVFSIYNSKEEKNIIIDDGKEIEVASPLYKRNGLNIHFKGKGNIVVLEKNVQFINSNINLGTNCFVRIDSNSTFGGLNINNRNHDGGVCYIGKNTIAPNNLSIFLFGNNKCIINEDCMFAANVSIFCSDGHAILNSVNDILNQNANVTIGRHVWLGLNAVVLKGASIGNGSVIGANTCITGKNFPDNSLIAGNPAEIKKNNIHWDIKNPEKI